ncbi:MAG TPA: aldehyde dehydrogenase family protein [Solirubrobacteraceae bacterium]|jgi:succinate-semialdehyde dehydrogenase/glutarate-semialdehyde dehydrogenase|nr:aldehyde dehydrogenase family protein [Solirubrobacteraceae bacterium]
MTLDAPNKTAAPAPASPGGAAELVAEVAKVQPLWALLRVQDRARYMLGMAQAVIDELDELREAIAAEQQRPRTEVAVLELLAAIDALKWIGRDGARVLGGRRVAVHRSLAPTKRARVAYEPYGVLGVLGAGSAPFAQPLGQIAGALLAGNGVVFKPAPRAREAARRIARVCARAGLPEGLVRILDGGPEAGLELARAPIGKLLFTGSPAVGREVAQACVAREVEVSVELGGKDAIIVLADANVERAAAAALWAGCAAAGQARGSVERVYVAPEVAERFVMALVARARALRVADPNVDPRAQVGPLSSPRRLERVDALVQEAIAQGATLHCGGPVTSKGGPSVKRSLLDVKSRNSDVKREHSNAQRGLLDAKGGLQSNAQTERSDACLYAPAILTGVTHEMRVMREQIGGPVLAVMSFESVSQAIALANDSPFGLGASVWSADRYRALRIARLIDAGMVWVNDHLPGPMISRGPWGAAAGSGLGRTLGEAGLRACAQEKLIAWEFSGSRGLWWGPYDELAAQAARGAAKLRSTREPDRERAWRDGALSLARVGARALARRS